jgi:hypothetical protein
MRGSSPSTATPRPRAPRAAIALASALLLSGCGYIVVPGDDSSPTPVATGAWLAVATKVEASAAGDLHVDLAIRNETGSWSAMRIAAAGSVTLQTSDGKTATCATAFVGTGGTSLAPGFQARGYTGGTKAKPAIQLIYVECKGAAPAPGSRLSIPYTYVTGDFNYYSPSAAQSGKLDVDLDKVAADLKYPVSEEVPGVVEKAGAKIVAINKADLTLTAVTRTADGLKLAWQTDNPTAYPTYVHIGIPPVIGADGVIYGFYESPHLADTPITPAGQSATWTTAVAVPKDVTGLYVLVQVESKQQKNFTSHAIDITDK